MATAGLVIFSLPLGNSNIVQNTNTNNVPSQSVVQAVGALVLAGAGVAALTGSGILSKFQKL